MQERRKRQRLPKVSIEAQIRLKKGFLSSEWVPVEVVDYNKLGAGLRCKADLKSTLGKGDPLQLSFRLGTEVGDIVVEKVGAVIRHTEDLDGGYMLGTEFDGDLKPGVSAALERIENVVSRFDELSKKVSAQT